MVGLVVLEWLDEGVGWGRGLIGGGGHKEWMLWLADGLGDKAVQILSLEGAGDAGGARRVGEETYLDVPDVVWIRLGKAKAGWLHGCLHACIYTLCTASVNDN